MQFKEGLRDISEFLFPLDKCMKLSTNTSIFVIIITVLLIILTGAKTNAQLCGKTLLDKDIFCGVPPIEQERLSFEKAKAKEREEAERVAQTKLEHKATRDKVDCLMNEIIMGRGEPMREYIFPDKNHRKNTCD
jgi:hypothetical protein